MLVHIDGWFSNLKARYKGSDIEVMSEGSDSYRFLDNGTVSLCLKFDL